MLCEECLRAFSSDWLDPKQHSSLASLIKAAADGCYICTPLWESIRGGPGRLEGDLEIRFTFSSCRARSYGFTHSLPEEHILGMHVGENGSAAYGSWRELDFPTFVAVPTANVPVNVGTYGRWSTIPMAESLQAAQRWMSTCLDTHEQCQKHKQPHAYPTRLLELDGHKVRLILPSEEEILGPYAALSYCWGPNPSFIRLTADNIRDFRLGIVYNNLPIAFQEAIRFIEGLGIRYLWIDALCIIQSGNGSSEDWQSECGRMQEVYSNCIINVSLAQAAHPDQSCMRGYIRKTALPFTTNISSRRWNALSTVTTPAYAVIPNQYFEHALYQQPIGNRAWVLQERLLATRVLSFGRGELFWDCQEVPNASETLPCGFSLCSRSGKELLSERLRLKIHSVPQTLDSRALEEAWSKILVEYSAMELTYPQVDKVIALSAISRCIGHALNDIYLAGHFWKMLPESLNWRAHRAWEPYFRMDEISPHRLPKASSQMLDGKWIVTPSWSWASMNGRLRTRRNDRWTPTVVATAEEYKLFSLGKTEGRPYVENIILLNIRTRCKRIIWTLKKPCAVSGTYILGEKGFKSLYVVIDEPSEEPNEGSMFLLAALCIHGYGVEGLLLKETNMYESKVWERLGHFTGVFDGIDGVTWQSLFTDAERPITIC